MVSDLHVGSSHTVTNALNMELITVGKTSIFSKYKRAEACIRSSGVL
jgi:energy-converting hydrogenase Eha subunit E